MKRIPLLIFILAISSFLAFANPAKENSGKISIGISQFVSHPALDGIATGIKDFLESTDFEYDIDLQIANGEISTASSIAKLFKSNGYKYVVGIATPTAQALANTFTDGTPVVYATVTDPEAAGLSDLDYVAGTTDQAPINKHLDMIQDILGAKLKVLGMIYTSSEANGLSQMERVRKECESIGVELVCQSVNNSSEVKAATEAIIDRIDALYIAIDNTVISAVSSVSDVALKHKVPLFTADVTSAFDTNVLLSGGFDYYKAGLQTGRILYEIINGKNPRDIKMEFVEEQDLYVNLDIAEQLGIEIPDNIINQCTYVFKNGINLKENNI